MNAGVFILYLESHNSPDLYLNLQYVGTSTCFRTKIFLLSLFPKEYRNNSGSSIPSGMKIMMNETFLLLFSLNGKGTRTFISTVNRACL